MRRIAIIIISLLGLISFDFFSKQYFESILQSSDIYLLWEFFKLHLSYNTGIAFSLPITWLPLQIITIILVIWLIIYYFREEYPKKSYLLDAWYTLVIAWALSHAYERIFVGHVVDFIAVKYFAIMNFADIFISIWAFLIILSYVFPRKHR